MYNLQMACFYILIAPAVSHAIVFNILELNVFEV